MRLSARLTLLFLALAAILVLAAGIAVVMRNQLATGIILRELAKRGTDAELQVSNLDWNQIVIQNIEVEELGIARFRLTYSIPELLNGQLRTADVEGLRANVDLSGDAPPLEGLQRLMSEFGASTRTVDQPAAALPPLPVVTLEDAQVSVLLPEREIALNLFGGLQPNDRGAEAQLSFEASSDPLLANGELNIVLEGNIVSSLAATANVSDRMGAIGFALSAQSAPLDMERPMVQLRLTGEGDANALAAYAPFDDAQPIMGGRFQANLEGVLSLPLRAENYIRDAESEMTFALELNEMSLANPGDFPAWMFDRIDAGLSGKFSLNDAALRGALDADVNYAEHPATLEFSTADVQARFADDYSLDSLELNAFDAALTNIPTPYATLEAASFQGNLANLLSGATGSVQIRATARDVALAAMSAQEAAVQGTVTLAPNADGYRLLLDGPARFSLQNLQLPALAPVGQLSGQVLAATLDLRTLEDGFSFRQSARVQLPELSLAVERQDAEPLRIQIESGPTDIESNGALAGAIGFTAATQLSAVEILEMSLSARNAQLDVSGTVGGEIDARLHGGTVLHDTENPFYTPLIPDFHLVQSGDDVSFGGELRGANDFLTVSLEGAHDLATGGGNAKFVVDELVFGRGRATETSVSPLLASMENLTGAVNGEANFAWGGGGFETGGRFDAEALSFRRNGMTIEGLSAEVAFDSLLPAHTPPGQHLSIRRIVTGIEDVTSLDLRFGIDTTEEGAPRIFTEALSLDIAGGRITAQGGTFDPVTGESDLPLRAENLDLARLLSHIGLEELTGEGLLNGTIPLRLSAGGASIEGAALQAGSAGIVTYRSPRAREALAAGGDAVNLMLDALEDFHYDSLDLTLSKPVTGDTAITLRLAGNNPAVLDGHPFDINISLSGDADPLLQALLAGQRLSSQLLRSITDR